MVLADINSTRKIPCLQLSLRMVLQYAICSTLLTCLHAVMAVELTLDCKKGGLVLQWHNDVTSDPAHLYSFVHQLKRLMVVLPPPPSSVTCTLFDVTPFRSVEHLRVRVVCLLITCVLCKWVHVCCVHVLLYVMYAVVCIYMYTGLTWSANGTGWRDDHDTAEPPEAPPLQHPQDCAGDPRRCGGGEESGRAL